MGKVGPGGRIMARWLDVKNVEGGYGSVKIIHGIDTVSYTHLTLPTILLV